MTVSMRARFVLIARTPIDHDAYGVNAEGARLIRQNYLRISVINAPFSLEFEQSKTSSAVSISTMSVECGYREEIQPRLRSPKAHASTRRRPCALAEPWRRTPTW